MTAGQVVGWSALPVVSEMTISGPNIGSNAPTTYRYARPRFDVNARTHQGFRLVEEARADGSIVDHYFYQDVGRTGQLLQPLRRRIYGRGIPIISFSPKSS